MPMTRLRRSFPLAEAFQIRDQIPRAGVSSETAIHTGFSCTSCYKNTHTNPRRPFVFLPSIATTLLAGKVVAIFGTRASLWSSLAVAGLGLPMMLSVRLWAVMGGMVLVGIGTFFAQACATGFVGQAAKSNRGVASGTYLACYFAGGLVGSAVLGQLFDRFGWPTCVLGVGASLVLGCVLTARLSH